MFRKTMMRGVCVAAFACPLFMVVLVAAVSNARAGEITYEMINYSQYYNGWNFPGGWNLKGAVTTDGTTGQITASNITSWNWTVTNGDLTYSANSTQPGTSLVAPTLYATSEFLALPLSSSSGVGLTSTIPPPAPYTLGDLSVNWWTHSNSVGTSCHWYTFSDTPVAPWWTDYISPIPNLVSTPMGSSWNFAAVPEPSTLALLGVGATGLLAYAWRRRPK